MINCVFRPVKYPVCSFLMLQVGQEGLAVLGVQRLDISPAGLLKLKLLQKAGNLLLQSLEVRQSSQVKPKQ